MKRALILLLAGILTLIYGGTAVGQTTETDIFGIEVGQATGYDFDNEEIVTSQLLGLHFGMTDEMEVGFVVLSGDQPAGTMPAFSLVRLTYFIQEMFGFHLSTGSATGNPAGGLGVFTSPIRREFNDTVTTSLRLSLDYLVPDFQTVGVNDGILSVSVSGKIAF